MDVSHLKKCEGNIVDYFIRRVFGFLYFVGMSNGMLDGREESAYFRTKR